ncbi:MAG TPA: CapA family protein [Clostridia bacterium]|nr:CapA family protein [Clostridia bacterium]
MNFKVFARTMFLVVVIAAIAFTIYSNISDGRERTDNNEAVGSAFTQDQGSGSGGQIPNTSENTGSGGNAEQEGSKEQESSTKSNYVKEDVSVNISALGDVALGQDHKYLYGDSFDYVFDKIKSNYDYFFSNVKSILSKDDLTVANLETTLSNETVKAEKYDYGNNYWFNGKPQYANILKAGSVEIADLANNHTYDFGQKGFDATEKALDNVGVDYFGYKKVLYRDVKGIRIGMAGFNQLGEYEQGLDMTKFKKDVSDTIKKMRSESDLVIVSFHWGKEYQYKQNALQTELAHLSIDLGADLVLGGHPHVLQPIEEYKGKYIAYSLGNFCFGGNKRPDDYDTAIYQQTFTFDSDKVLQPVTEPKIIPCSVSSRADLNVYQPTVATGEQSKRVFQKLAFTPKLSEEEKAAYALKNDMVRLDALVKNIVTDLRYAGSDNIIGKPVYESGTAYLRKGTADKLDKANKLLLKQGFRIKVWDAYRSQKDHQLLYDNAPDKSVFMDPRKGPSNHTRGAAVDCTLVTKDGGEVDMPSDFDDGTALAYRTYEKCTEAQKKNALILQNAMKSVGFIPLQKEWWHFDDSEYRSYTMLASYP